MSNAPRHLAIDIYSDIMCPWCLVGYGQLQKALAQLDGEIAATIRWRPFELNPDMPPQGEDRSEHIARKYRRTAAETQGVQDHMRNAAEEAGVSLDYTGEGDAPPAMMWNSFHAHKMLAWVLDSEGAEKQTELKLALFEAHFNHRRNIADRSVLLDIAEHIGLDRTEATAALDSDDLTDRVRAEEAQAMDLNITGVPAMIVERRMLIPGAQPPEVYVNALRRVAEKTAN
ncbi:MAG: DsbA family oxidoreductase [Pontixanthobacter sp.]